MSPAITEVTVGAATAAEFNLNAMAILFHRFGPGATDKTSRMKDGDLKDAVANYADLLRQAQGEEIDCSELVMNIRANDVRTAGFDYKDMKVSVLCSDETVGDDVRVINNVNVVFVQGPSVENIKLNEPFSRGYGINVDGDSINFYVALTDQLVGSNNRTVVSGQIANLFYYLESFYGPGSKGEFNSNQGYYKTLLESGLTVQ